jgi:hypothetical protein
VINPFKGGLTRGFGGAASSAAGSSIVVGMTPESARDVPYRCLVARFASHMTKPAMAALASVAMAVTEGDVPPYACDAIPPVYVMTTPQAIERI